MRPIILLLSVLPLVAAEPAMPAAPAAPAFDGERIAALVEALRKALPEAASDFKKTFPHGRFEVRIHIDIVSDERDAKPVSVTLPQPAEPKPRSSGLVGGGPSDRP